MLVDKEQALKMQNGDVGFLMEIWKIFVEDARTKIDSFEQAMQEENYHQVERLAHSLKSSSAVIGSGILSEQAAQLEETARSEEPDAIQSKYAQFRETLDGVLGYLNQELKS